MSRHSSQALMEGQAAPDRDGARVGGAERVLATLRTLAGFPEGAPLEQIARAVGAPKSSVHRALAILKRAGFAGQYDDGAYHLGVDFVRLAFTHHEQRPEQKLVQPVVDALASRFGETAHYAVLDMPDIVYLAKTSPPVHGLQMTSVIGGRNPAHCTALGKCLLAFTLGSEKAVAAYVGQRGPLQRRTPTTLTTAARLHREFVAIRRDGYAVDREESEVGLNCIAFPVFLGSPARPTGAVSISALAQRTPLSRLVAAAPEIRACIEERLVTRPLLTG